MPQECPETLENCPASADPQARYEEPEMNTPLSPVHSFCHSERGRGISCRWFLYQGHQRVFHLSRIDICHLLRRRTNHAHVFISRRPDFGSVGPKSKMQAAPAAEARCEMPLSCPIKIDCSRTAAK